MQKTMAAQNLSDVSLYFFTPDFSEIQRIPYFDGGVRAGFESPANDFEENKISFDEIVLGNCPSTKFYVRIEGTSMQGAGIDHNDIAVVDKAAEPTDGCIAVCRINGGDYTLKRLKVMKDCIYLMPENAEYDPIVITNNENFEVWGIVTYTLKDHTKKR